MRFWLLAHPRPAIAQTLAGGMNHSVILKSDGTVWTVGANASGQLGDNTTTQRKTPIQVSGLNGVVGTRHRVVLDLASMVI